MKIYTSYFYQIRFFSPDMIPISTANSDPRWFHEGKGKEHWFIDKNGVINGLRAPVFAPGPSISGLCCGHENCANDPSHCPFLRGYTNQLANLDFEDVLARTEALCRKVASFLDLQTEPTAVFIVHEAPQNSCSERAAIQNLFKQHGVECVEWKHT